MNTVFVEIDGKALIAIDEITSIVPNGNGVMIRFKQDGTHTGTFYNVRYDEVVRIISNYYKYNTQPIPSGIAFSEDIANMNVQPVYGCPIDKELERKAKKWNKSKIF